MNLQTELDALAAKIASFHEPATINEDDWQQYVDSTTVALMAGGESSRFSSVLEGTQANKSAFELPNGDTMIEMCIRMYKDMGFKHFVALVFHNAHSIEDRLGDGSKLGVTINYSYDPEIPIGKGGAVLNALENGSIPETNNLIVVNPDDVVLHFPEFPRYISQAHLEGTKNGAIATAVLGLGQAYHSTGMMVVDNKVVDTKMYPFIPVPAHVGITLFSPEAYGYFRQNFSLTEKSDFENVLFPVLAQEGKLWSAGLTKGLWIAVNDAKTYKQLVQELQ
jgi:NDP-sugar pyrophosphorylase family protein